MAVNILTRTQTSRGVDIIYPSAELLRTLISTHPKNLEAPNLDVCWRWSGPLKALNSKPKIDNFQQLVILAGSGIDVPTITQSKEVVRGWLKDGYAVWGRKYNHTQALDVRVPGGRGFLEKSDFWVRIIPEPFEEYRQHILCGRAIARGKKVQTGPTTLVFGARNRRNGWTLQRDVPVPPQVRECARGAVEALGYDFGAVDVIFKNDVATVLEVNKAPGLDMKTASAYVEGFMKVAYGEWER